MKTLTKIVLSTVFVSFSSLGLAAGDIEAGKARAATCAACHGANGISAVDIWPNLAGQKAGYLTKQIKAFRDGTRKDPSMSPMAAGLTDQDVENLSAYFASLK